MMHTHYRSHHCGELNLHFVGQTVRLCGWVQRTRDLGKFLFLDLRDRYGITQIAFRAEEAPDLYEQAKKLGREYVLQVGGTVIERESKNPVLPTGEIEVLAKELKILNSAKLPPFLIEDQTDGNEELRLKYRYLDIRRPAVQRNLILRTKVVKAVREYLDGNAFLEIETPNLIKTTPEGARDFIVPSRLHKGSFYALPQSPQILKQLLMVAGMDRYYQICKCFRDEDFRGDRQPEFTQIDCEMSFVSQNDVLNMFEGMIKHVYQTVLGIHLPDLPRITYADAIKYYGTDKPDLRFDMKLHDLSAVVAQVAFPAFQEALANQGAVIGINAKGCGELSRKQLDYYIDFVKSPHRGLKGLLSIKVNSDGSFKTSADKFFTPEQLAHIAYTLQAQPNDLLLIGAGKTTKARKAMGDLRLEVARQQNMIPENEWSVFYVVDFPLFERDEETGQIMSTHHPFVMPNPEDWHKFPTEPESVRALCYDMVINGNEIMSGSIRIHDREIQNQIFTQLGLSEEEKTQKFGFLLDAFEYGAPPHGGCAFGLDRMVMLFVGGESIRDVMAFPKNSAGRDMMLDAPSSVDADALNVVGIELSKQIQ